MANLEVESLAATLRQRTDKQRVEELNTAHNGLFRTEIVNWVISGVKLGARLKRGLLAALNNCQFTCLVCRSLHSTACFCLLRVMYVGVA